MCYFRSFLTQVACILYVRAIGWEGGAREDRQVSSFSAGLQKTFARSQNIKQQHQCKETRNKIQSISTNIDSSHFPALIVVQLWLEVVAAKIAPIFFHDSPGPTQLPPVFVSQVGGAIWWVLLHT